MLRFFTAGESHGEALVALLSGLPAGVPVDQDFVNHELWRRQQGYGRGGRMRIEKDEAHILSGVRHGKTIGSPIAMTLANKDWKNWEQILPVESGDPSLHKAVASPRPGHADLAGALKYDFKDARYVLERASARESAARVACGHAARIDDVLKKCPVALIIIGRLIEIQKGLEGIGMGHQFSRSLYGSGGALQRIELKTHRNSVFVYP